LINVKNRTVKVLVLIQQYQKMYWYCNRSLKLLLAIHFGIGVGIANRVVKFEFLEAPVFNLSKPV